MKYKLGSLTVNNWNDWDRVPRDPISIGTAIAGAIGVTSAVGTALIIGATYIGITAVTSWAISALAPKPDFSSFGSSGTLVNARDAVAAADFVYGEVRKGGVITFYESTGEENKFLHQVIAIAAHEVEELGDIYINDSIVSWNASTGLVGGDWDNKIRIRKHLGDQTTVDSDLNNETSVGSGFVGNGIAYLYVRYEYDQDVFANGLPLVTVMVKGKKVYDPRTASTAYSNNAALCMRDFLTSEYGLNDSAIDEVSFSAAANECDESVSLSGSGTEKRYTINGIVKASTPLKTVFGNMSTACAGTLFWGSGYWKLKVGAYSSPVKTLTLDDLRGPINLQTRISMRDNFNTIRGTFNDAVQDYITADYPELTSATFKAEDNGEEVALDLPLPFTTSAAAAQRLAKLTLFRGREQMTLSADFGLEAFSIEVGDIIAFDNPRYGFDEKEFEVVGWSFAANQQAGDLRVTLTLRETSAAAFDWNAEESAIISNNTTLPVYTAGMNIFGLSVNEGGKTQSDGTRITTGLLQWTAVQSAYVERYEVQWKPTADSSYATTYTTNNTIELSPIIDGIEYTFRVRAVSANGYRGPFASVTFTGGGDTTAPAVPTNISAQGGYKYITISFDRPNDSDFSQIEVYENASSGFSGAYSVGFTSGDSFIRSNLSNAVTRYYWARSIDFTGNASAFVGPVSATTALIEGADLTETLLNTIAEAGVKPVNSLPATGDYEGQIVFLLTNNVLYRWTGSAWSDELYAGVQDGAVTAEKVAANAITTAKIASGAVTAGEIASNAVTGIKIATSAITETKIASDAITTPKIAAGAITAGEIAASAVTTGKIAAGTITASEIAAGTITGSKIATNTLTATNIAAGAINASELNANAVTADKISAGAVVTDKIAASAIVASKIASGTITADKLNVSELSAITAQIGTFSSAASGARLVLEDDRIVVYDSSNVVRVKIGNLA